MSSRSWAFNVGEGGEQNYMIPTGVDKTEIQYCITSAIEDGIELITVTDAECTVVMITTRQIAELLLPLLNDEKLQPLNSLS